jgi:hypothetical protein
LSSEPALRPPQRRRLREIWRSAGWPAHDPIELDLLAAGCLQRVWDAQGRETLRVTELGLQQLARARQRSTAALQPHEALVGRVAELMQREGRIVWRGLSLRAPLVGDDGSARWVTAMPDVFSIRPSSLEDGLLPLVHEVKVRRADLLADLKRAEKRQAYQGLAAGCCYVLAEGVGDERDVPPPFGVLLAAPGTPGAAGGFTLARAAQLRPVRMTLLTWVSLARANAEPGPELPPQAALGAPDEAG